MTISAPTRVDKERIESIKASSPVATKVWELTKSLIEDFVTPLIFSPILKKLKIEKLEDLSWRWVLYWKLLARGIDFIIVALVVFLVIKAIGVEI
jgi:large conductance mechanosensitive channel